MKLILDRDNTRDKIVLRIDSELYSKLKQIANERNASATFVINEILHDYIEEYEKDINELFNK